MSLGSQFAQSKTPIATFLVFQPTGGLAPCSQYAAVRARPLGYELALQLRFLRSSESIGHHDSEIVDDGYFD